MSVIHITKGSGKMAGIQSINTSTTDNAFCQKMASNDNAICSKCYADRYEKMRGSLHAALLRNTTALSSGFIPMGDLPSFYPTQIVRFSSFGELENDIHLVNLLNIAIKNPQSHFTLWTKRANIVRQVLSRREKPANLTLIYSSPALNVQAKRPSFFDKVFTVYQSKHANDNSVEINCGAKSCDGCRICYSDNEIIYVNEKLK